MQKTSVKYVVMKQMGGAAVMRNKFFYCFYYFVKGCPSLAN